MSIILDIIILACSGICIMRTADMLVSGAVELSLALKLSKVLIASTIVSLVTTMPEFIVSVSSSIMGNSGMAVGNAVGSCICNIGLIFAVGAMIKNIKVDKKELTEKIIILFASLFAVLFLGMNRIIGINGAAILFLLLLLFMYFNYQSAIKQRMIFEKDIEAEGGRYTTYKGLYKIFVGGFLTITLARFGLLGPGLNIAAYLGVPSILIGLTLVAIGTSLPELFTAITASKKGHGEIALGNVIGANILNLLWVLGASAMTRPLQIDLQTILFNIPAAILFTALLYLLGIRSGKYTRGNGIVLMLLYVLYILILFIVPYRD